ncbi:MAG: phosphotransferase [Nanoarchaeota archaeon]
MSITRTVLERQEIEFLSDSYNILVSGQSLPSSGSTNQVVFLEEPSGKKFVAKKYTPDFTPALATFQIRVNQYAWDQQVPTPQVICNRQGEVLSVHDGRVYAVSTFLPGSHPDQKRLDEIILALKGLALLNSTLEKFTDTEGYDTLPRFKTPLHMQFEDMAKHLPEESHDEIDEYVLSHAARIRRTITEVEERIAQIRHPLQVIHGDYNLGCALVQDGKLTGVLDYDLLRKDYRGTDALHCIDLYCFEKEAEGMTLEDRVDWEKMKACFRAYREDDPGITDQLHDMPLMLANSGLNSLIITWDMGYNPAARKKHRDYFAGRYAFFVNRVNIALELEERIVDALKQA